MSKLTKKQDKAVRSIVITYPAWRNARDECKAHNGAFVTETKLNSLRVWARMLKADQIALGVELVPVELLDANQANKLDAEVG